MRIDLSLGAAVLALCLVAGASASRGDASGAAPAEGAALASPQNFAGIADPAARSAAYFAELGKVLTHPRCTNCHPAGDRPRQGDEARPHQPPVYRGADGRGLPALRCASCHHGANFDPAGMPGHPAWHLAPAEMAWEGRTVSQICAQIKDPARNGGRTPQALIEHIGDDTLVGWAWVPGRGRSPAPGTQKAAKALVEAWVESGAACP